MKKLEAIEKLTSQQKVIAKKAIRIIKYYPKPKRDSTLMKRASRVYLMVICIISIQAKKRMIASQVDNNFKQGGIIVYEKT